MDFIQSLGSAGIVPRMKGLSERMMKDIQKIYKDLESDFEPRWLMLFQYLLKKKTDVPVTVIAKDLHLTHPAVIQVLNAVEKSGLVETKQDKQDHRKRLVSLSQRGKELALKITPVWDDIRDALEELVLETDPAILELMEKLEEKLNDRTLYNRISDKVKFRMLGDIKLIEYEKDLYPALKKVYLQCISDHFDFSEKEKISIVHEMDKTLDGAGKIFLLTYKGDLAGSFALDITEKATTEIKLFCLRKDLKKWGMDEKLFGKALNMAVNTGASSVYFFIPEGGSYHKKLLQSFGFMQAESDEIPEGPFSIPMIYQPGKDEDITVR